MFRTLFDKPLPTALDKAERLAGSPSGGRITMWLLGFCLALIPIGYGVHFLSVHRATFFGRGGSRLELHGAPAVALAVAYIAVGLFIHAHWFWGLHPRLQRFSYFGKLLSLLVFVPTFGYAVYRIFLSSLI